MTWLFTILPAIASEERSDTLAAAPQPEACFNAGTPRGDKSVAEILLNKTRGIIGRIGCGADDAAYLIVPSLVVEEVNRTSGMVRNVTLAKGTLTLEAVSAKNPDMVWHSITIPLTATMTGKNENAAEALAKQIKISDSAYVRFVRVARKKIAEANTTKPQKSDL